LKSFVRCAARFFSSWWLVFWTAISLGAIGTAASLGSEGSPLPGADSGLVQVPAFSLPNSYFLTPESRSALKTQSEIDRRCTMQGPLNHDSIVAMRACLEKNYYPALLDKLGDRYRVSLRSERIAGVPSQVVTPADGIAPKNQDRVLINLHGGGFMYGTRYGGQIESIPIAAVGRIKVVSVDYRLIPENTPADATQDVLAVYKELLKSYRPQNIGIYGCSAGAVLTGRALARLHLDKDPMPGAIGMLGGGAFPLFGDSQYVIPALLGHPLPYSPQQAAAIQAASAEARDPLLFPGNSPQIMSNFPPTLLVTATRDHGLSSVIATHNQLIKLNVRAELHVWDGVGHCFQFDADLEPSRDAYAVIVRFFAENLGRH
jgi:monoterpene epsilon-lactone hydrolase